MLKVLLVDDEPYNRRGLSVLVDWEREGFQIAGEASNGEQALEEARKQHFDLILTDIKMPVMDGFRLIEALRSEMPEENMHFIIVSGYDDFENAKRAMRNGCVDFLTKPVSREELVRALRAVASECEKQRRDEDDQRIRDRLIRERHLTALTAGKYDDVNLSYVREHMTFEGKLRYISIELDPADLARLCADETQKRGMQRDLYEKVIELMDALGSYVLIDVDRNTEHYDVGFIYMDSFAKRQGVSEQQYLTDLRARISNDTPCGVLFHVGCEVEDIERISESYRSACFAQLITALSHGSKELRATFREPISENKRKLMDELVDAIVRGDKDNIDACVNRLYDMFANSETNYRDISPTIHYLMLCLIRAGIDRAPEVDQDDVMQYLAGTAFDRDISRGSKSHFLSFCRQYSEYFNQLAASPQEEQQSGSVLDQVQHEIEQNYMKNISLKSMSEKFFINSAYLGQLFRKRFGKSFKEYLNGYRIEKAAELLVTTNMRVYQISEAVGYQSLDYFITKFVEIKDHTPSQYRKKFGRHDVQN